MDVYELVRGPFAWFALAIFVVGSLYQLFFLFLTAKKETVPTPSSNTKDAVRSILLGLVPFGTVTMRRQPVFTLLTFIFHLGVVVLPVFLLAHIVLWYESWKIQWWSLPDGLADLMTLWVILACIYFFFRRRRIPEVKQVTRPSDYALLGLIMLTFLSGFCANHQWGPYRAVLILHVLSGEMLLVILPFSKLGHMLFFGFSRAYMGLEFGKILKARDC